MASKFLELAKFVFNIPFVKKLAKQGWYFRFVKLTFRRWVRQQNKGLKTETQLITKGFYWKILQVWLYHKFSWFPLTRSLLLINHEWHFWIFFFMLKRLHHCHLKKFNAIYSKSLVLLHCNACNMQNNSLPTVIPCL